MRVALRSRHMTPTSVTPRLDQILQTPIANRNEAWELELLRELPKTSVRIVEESAVAGPDGWPYLLVATDGMAADGAGEPMVNIVQWLATRGMGFVVNPEKAMPDFVMTYGMVWNFRERGEFLTPVAKLREGTLEIRDQQQLYTGAPSLAYLPEDVRAILRDFFKRQRVLEPKVLMISTDQEVWDLAFSIESLGSPKSAEHAGIAEALSWFLPAHYSVALVSEKNVPGFAAL